MSYYEPKQQQPGFNPGMQITQGGNRNALNLPTSSDGERAWSHGLCGCCGSFGTCLKATFCACCVYNQNKTRYEHLNSTGRPHPDGGENCGCGCCLFAILHHIGFSWALQMGVRSDIRKRYRISGGCCGDCCSALCCMPCDLTQSSRELELEEKSFRG